MGFQVRLPGFTGFARLQVLGAPVNPAKVYTATACVYEIYRKTFEPPVLGVGILDQF
jgi:hypothetical protein